MVYVIESSVNGVLSAIFKSFYDKEIPDRVVSNKSALQLSFGENAVRIDTDNIKAERVKKSVYKFSGSETLYNLFICFLSGEENKEKAAFDFLRLTLTERKDISKRFNLPVVIAFNEIVQRVLWERHRIGGLLRFSVTLNGVLYAHYSPDNDITGLLAPHFLARFQAPFVIHDVSRNRFAFCDGKKIKIIDSDEPVSIMLDNDEAAFKALWKKYYNSVNIKERKNLRQQNAYMPKRYRKHMEETFETD